MADTRYLQRKNGRWYFQISVPRDLQAVIGKRVITKYLRTADTRKAQNDRWEHVAAWKAAFKRARDGQGLSADEIEAEAQTEYRRIANNMVIEPNPYHEQIAGRTGDPVTLALSDWLHDNQADLTDGDYSRVNRQVEEVTQRTGADLDQEGRDQLAKALLRAHIAAFADAISLRQGEDPPAARTLNTSRTSLGRVRTRRGKGMPVSQAAREFVQEKTRSSESGWTAQTKKQCEAVYRLFADHVGDSPIDSVKRDDAISFRATVARLHPNWARSIKAKGLPLADLLETYGVPEGEPGLSARTLERYTSALVSLFGWLRDRGLYEGDNPFSRLGTTKNSAKRLRKERTKYLPFTADELTALFHSPLLLETNRNDRVSPRRHGTRTALMWLPLVSLFTGMRSEEIAQLRPLDVREENGVLFIRVAEEGDGQHVKSAAAYRRVPVHSMLIKCGFKEYMERIRKKHHDFLFPGLKPGGPDGKRNWYFSRAFTVYRRRCGVERIDSRTGRDRIAFHSFRATVATALENAGIPESEAVQVLGHEKMSLSYGLYSGGLDLRGLRRVVEKIKYPGLGLSHLCQKEK